MSISISKDNGNKINIEPVLEIKRRLAVNRDGLSVGSTISATYANLNYTATVLKLGYGYNGKLFYSLSELSTYLFKNEVDPMDIWKYEGKPLRQYVMELL